MEACHIIINQLMPVIIKQVIVSSAIVDQLKPVIAKQTIMTLGSSYSDIQIFFLSMKTLWTSK